MAPEHCDGMGNCVGCMQDTDCPMVPECQKRHCDTMNMTCAPTDSNAETPCSMGNKVCDGMGNCVPCVMDGDCGGAPQICSSNACISSCGDGKTDGTETDQDCGGACPGCAVNKMCKQGSDCQSTFCQGGTTCQLAPDGHACMSGAQCANGNCVAGICCHTACGGTCMACTHALTNSPDGTCAAIQAGMNAPMGQCTVGATCGNDGNCDGAGHCEQASNQTVCAAAACANDQATPTRKCDGMGNCTAASGTSCAPYNCNAAGTLCLGTCNSSGDCVAGNYCDMTDHCVPLIADGSMCQTSSQCLHGFCNPSSNDCALPTCSDTFQDGNETDIDCGGTGFMGAAACSKCADGKMCKVNADCVNNVCVGNLCYPASCGDGMQDNSETDTDCGGGTCPTCANNKHCMANTDCTSGNCNMGQHKCM
jgi:hypothetical protein